MISEGALIAVLFGIVLVGIGLAITCFSLYTMIQSMRKNINKNFSLVKKDIDVLDSRTRHLTGRESKVRKHYIMPEPGQGKDYTR